MHRPSPPSQPGDGPRPKKAAPLPSVWGGLSLVGSCEVAHGPKNILDWCAFLAPPSSHHASVTSRLRPRHGRGHDACTASITAGTSTRQGRLARCPAAGRRGGPNQGRAGGAQKTEGEAESRSETEAWRISFACVVFENLFKFQRTRLVLKFEHSQVLSDATNAALLRLSECWLAGRRISAAAQRAVSVGVSTPFRPTGRSQYPSGSQAKVIKSPAHRPKLET